MSDLPVNDWCPIGPLGAHTYNAERTECIWCGPHALAWKPGKWVDLGDGTRAWSVDPADLDSPAPSTEGTSANS